jgi:uncharacterized membrane protein YgdD (TMEM256/DUF423 family)
MKTIMMAKYWITLGAGLAFLAVATGAFGAHALSARFDQNALAIWETASKYQMYHALGLILIGILTYWSPSTNLVVTGWCFFIGTLLFSGSLYTLTLTGIRTFGAITPLGGTLFMIGWASLAVWGWRNGATQP